MRVDASVCYFFVRRCCFLRVSIIIIGRVRYSMASDNEEDHIDMSRHQQLGGAAVELVEVEVIEEAEVKQLWETCKGYLQHFNSIESFFVVVIRVLLTMDHLIPRQLIFLMVYIDFTTSASSLFKASLASMMGHSSFLSPPEVTLRIKPSWDSRIV
jgi:hypothetical protein